MDAIMAGVHSILGAPTQPTWPCLVGELRTPIWQAFRSVAGVGCMTSKDTTDV